MSKKFKEVQLCKGCELCKDGKIPIFKSEKEEGNFWAEHSPLDFPDEFEDIEIEVVKHGKKPVSIRLDQGLVENVKKLAYLKNVKYQTLIQEWIKEKFNEEETKLTEILKNKMKTAS